MSDMFWIRVVKKKHVCFDLNFFALTVFLSLSVALKMVESEVTVAEHAGFYTFKKSENYIEN